MLSLLAYTASILFALAITGSITVLLMLCHAERMAEIARAEVDAH